MLSHLAMIIDRTRPHPCTQQLPWEIQPWYGRKCWRPQNCVTCLVGHSSVLRFTPSSTGTRSMARLLWTQKQDIGPKPRIGHSMVFDAAQKKVVLFGGDSLIGGLWNDTWEWDGEDWTQTADIGPRPRAYHAMAYD